MMMMINKFITILKGSIMNKDFMKEVFVEVIKDKSKEQLKDNAKKTIECLENSISFVTSIGKTPYLECRNELLELIQYLEKHKYSDLEQVKIFVEYSRKQCNLLSELRMLFVKYYELFNEDKESLENKKS